MTISLTTENSYPLNGTTTFPIGEEIKLEFTNLVDDKTVKDSIVLLEKVSNLVVETDIKSYPVDDNLVEITDNFLIRKVAQKTLVIIKPKVFLEPNRDYELFIRGSSLEEVVSLNTEFASNTISERTVFGTSKDDTFTDQIKVYGSYSGKLATELNIEITSSGVGSAAKYIWWFENEAKPQASGKRLNRTASRWRSLNRGCYVKFYGGDYTLGDTFKVKVYPKEKLTNSYRMDFSTASDSLVVKPEVTSESDVGLLIPTSDVATLVEDLRVVEMQPKNGSINNICSTNKIIITFNKDLDAASITQDVVRLFKQPVSGFFNSASKEEKIPKEVIVENNKIILEF